jgi:hypothetical protein
MTVEQSIAESASPAEGDPTGNPTDAQPVASAALKEAKNKRADLHAFIVELEEAIAAPAIGRALDWAMRVHDELVEVGAAFERHIAVVEGPDGLFEEVTQAAPRLTNALQQLADEHREIRTLISEALDAVRHVSGAREGAPDQGRAAVLRVLDQLMRHRQLGADVVYEAYAVDIGTGD